MSKKIMKRSLALGALMAFVITGSAWAETYVNGFEVRYDEEKNNDNPGYNTTVGGGIYYFKKGSMDTQLLDLKAYKGNIEINIEDNGIIDIEVENKGSEISWPIDIYGRNGYPVYNDSAFTTVVNGSISIVLDECASTDERVINVADGYNTFVINGDLNIENQFNNYQGSSTVYTEGVRAWGSTINLNGNVNMRNMKVSSGEGKKAFIAGMYVTDTNMDGNSPIDANINIGKAGKKLILDEIEVIGKNSTYQIVSGILSEGCNSKVNIDSSAVIKNIKSIQLDEANEAYVSALEANGGIININNGIVISGLEASVKTDEGLRSNENATVKAVDAYSGGVINLKDTDLNVIDITGDISSIINGTVNLSMINSKSVFNGATTYNYFENAQNYFGTLNLTLSNGATWNVKDRYNDSVDGKNSYVTTLGGEGGIIKMDIDASQKDVSNKLFVDTHTGTHYVQLNNTGSSDDGAGGTVLIKVKDEQGVFKANDKEGTLYWNKYDLASRNTETQTLANEDDYKTEWYLEKVEQITPSDKPTTSVSMALVDSSLVYHTWRTENDKLMQRMGELRLNGADEQGAWFRVKGTKINHSGNLGFENEYTTYELGYDKLVKQTEEKSCYQGVALSYNDGEAKYFKGSGDNESKSIGFYRTEVGKKGDYLDLVVRVSDSDNKYSVYDTNSNKIKGDTNNWGIALSAEAGRKNMLSDGWYVEPQAQFTIGHLNGDSYKTSNGIYVEQDDIFSAVGRLGVNVGKELGEKGIVYVKANLLHEFAGDFDVNMSDSSGNVSVGEKFDDTWFEYGLGLSYQTGKNNYIYFDVERTSGSDFEKEWSWNAGVRWFF